MMTKQMKPGKIKYKSPNLMDLIDSYQPYVEIMELYIINYPKYTYTIELIPGDYMHSLEVSIHGDSTHEDETTNEGGDPSDFIS
jgi:hypothetical protein